MSTRLVTICDVCGKDIPPLNPDNPELPSIDSVLCQLTFARTNVTHRKDLCWTCANEKLLPIFGVSLVPKSLEEKVTQ